MKKIFLVVLLSLSFLSLSFNFVQAVESPECQKLTTEQKKGGVVPCGRACDDPTTLADETVPCQFCHFFQLFKNIVDFLLIQIVPPLAVLMLAIAGFMYIFAYLNPGGALPGGAGGPALLSQAKKIITSVIWGLVIIFAAWLVINTLFMVIGVADWTGLTKGWKEGWWQINCPTQ